MGKIRTNGYTVEFSGRVGRHVFRRLPDGRIIACIQADRTNYVPTAAQVAVNEEFKKAVDYAKAALSDPVKRDAYKARVTNKTQTPFTLAVADWFVLPGIETIDVTNFHGHIGEKIRLVAFDNIAVAAVTVEIRTSDDANTLLESGPAAKTGADWFYTATTNLPAGQPAKIVATAKDLSGHGTTETKLYS